MSKLNFNEDGRDLLDKMFEKMYPNSISIASPSRCTRPNNNPSEKILVDVIKNKIEMVNNAVDVGVRVELPAPVMEPITSRLYESKLIYHTPTFGDEVRTFCMNPNGEVVNENYNGISTVNGHSYADKKTPNTNFVMAQTQQYDLNNIVSSFNMMGM